jgi:hypothetical protein
MPRHYNNKNPVDPERTDRLIAAVKVVRDRIKRRLPPRIRETAKEHAVSYGSLRYQLSGCSARGIAAPKQVKRPGAQPKLGALLEKKLCEWVVTSCKVNLTPTMMQLQLKAARVGAKLGVTFQNSNGSKLPSSEWVMAFLRRHHLTYRKCAALCKSRQDAEVDLPNLQRFSEVYSKLLDSPCEVDGRGRVLKTYRYVHAHTPLTAGRWCALSTCPRTPQGVP